MLLYKQFLFTYGDGLSDVNLKELITQHNKSNAIVTLTGVRSPARFGVLKLQKEGALTEEKVLDHAVKMMNLVQECNVTLRWMMLHTAPLSPSKYIYSFALSLYK